ncbi:unnamed protein product [Schistosoma mattheei]|uniref:PAZ domain-containing protein n=1 Tax=Schistosoma mattheei TaxID=31246 RepID=A0A183P021_9TREM|nr:unnamed protein product [Schistosoma mattheei]VDP41030.1 unnamed protein product [Schistosoma mattheei]
MSNITDYYEQKLKKYHFAISSENERTFMKMNMEAITKPVLFVLKNADSFLLPIPPNTNYPINYNSRLA